MLAIFLLFFLLHLCRMLLHVFVHARLVHAACLPLTGLSVDDVTAHHCGGAQAFITLRQHPFSAVRRCTSRYIEHSWHAADTSYALIISDC